MILYSIIIPTYNSKKTIARTLRSVLKQNLKFYEIICVDDGSTDNTINIIKRFKIRNLRIIRLLHSGLPAKNINLATKFSKGKFLAILDSDDEWHENKLIIQNVELNKRKIDIIGSNGYVINGFKKKKIFEKKSQYLKRKDLLKNNLIPCSSLIIKKKIFNELNGLCEQKNLKSLYDYEFLLRANYYKKFIYISNKLCINYFDNPKFSIRKNDKNFFFQFIYIAMIIIDYKKLRKYYFILLFFYERLVNFLTKRFIK